MPHFLSQHLENVHFFKDQAFDFNHKGVSLILGSNANAGASTNTNGVGKSLFFSQLPEMLMDEPLIGTRADRLRKGSRSFEFQSGKNVYRVQQKFGPTKVEVFKNDNPMSFHGVANAMKFVRDKIGMTDAEVKTFLYLDSAVPHPLISGDTASRKRFFLEFFSASLGSLDSVRRIIKDELDRLTAIRRSYDINTERVKELKGKIPKNLADLRAEAEALSDEVEASSRLADKYAPISRLFDRIARSQEEADALESIGVSSTAELDEYTAKLERKIANARKVYKAAMAFADWKKAQDKRKSRLKEAHQTLEDHPWFRKRPKNKETLATAEEKMAKLREFRKNAGEDLDSARARIRDLTRSIRDLESAIADLEHQNDHASKDVGTCPTCGGAYDNKKAKELIRINKSYIAQHQEALRVAKKTMKAPELAESHLEELEQLLSGVEEQLPLLKNAVNALEDVLQDQSGDEDAPADPGVDVADLDEKLERMLDRKAGLPVLGNYLVALEEYAAIPVKTRRAAKAFSVSSIADKAMKLADLKAQLARIDAIREEVDRLQGERAEQLEQLSDLDAVELLTQATSKKGMEKLIIRALCKQLEEQVNKYAKMMFAEDFVFSFDLETQFNITVTRRYGKKEIPSDVRKLSGAERKLFALVLIPSLMAFVPKSRRSNLLILDEPTAAMGPANVASFVRFLPLLNSVIPHIVVITPLSAVDYYSIKPRVYTVVKKKGISTIIENKEAIQEPTD